MISTVAGSEPVASGTPPVLAIAIEGARIAEYAAVPTLCFPARITSSGSARVRAVTLTAQIRIAAARRPYDPDSQRRLVELFGLPEQWSRSLRGLLWTQTTVPVPAFDDATTVDVPVPCTYDFEVVATKYLHALTDGEVPLEFLFSGTIFYTDGPGAGPLRVARIPWDTEAQARMPVAVWRELMAHYFPRTGWLRLPDETFDRLRDYRSRHALVSWEDTVEALLRCADREPAR